MGKHISPPYECYRCGYKTNQKHHMRMHMERKTTCPATNASTELTQEIKQEILRSRIYRPQLPSSTVPCIFNDASHMTQPHPHSFINFNTHIYNYNNMNAIMNIITPNLSDGERVIKFVEYKQKEMISLCDDVENMFQSQIRKFRNDEYFFGYHLTINEILELFDKILKLKYDDFTDMNIIYNKENNKINILDDTLEWEDHLLDRGIQYIIECVQDCFLHEYERYLASKIRSLTGQTKQSYKERLEEYYRFIAVFDMPPLCSDKNKHCQIDFITNDVIDEFYPLFVKVKKSIKVSEKNELKRKFVDIVKHGSEKNTKNFYTEFYNLYNKNDRFKEYITKLGCIDDDLYNEETSNHKIAL